MSGSHNSHHEDADVVLALNETDIHGYIEAHATVTHGTHPVKHANVIFEVDRKVKGKPVATDSHGIATKHIELEEGDHVIKVRVAGADAEDEELITIGPKIVEPPGPIMWILTAIFWILLMILGPSFELTLTYLVLTMIVIKFVAKMRRKTFTEALLCENNWVFFSLLAMTIITAFMADWNVMKPKPRWDAAWDWAKSALGGRPERLGRNAFWGLLNKFFFERARTNEWAQAAKIYGLWTIGSIFISFWDNVRDAIKKKVHEESAKGWIGLITHLKYESVLELVEALIKIPFKIFKK